MAGRIRVERAALGRLVVRAVCRLEILVSDDPDEPVAVLFDPAADDLEPVRAAQWDDLLAPLAGEVLGSAGQDAVDLEQAVGVAVRVVDLLDVGAALDADAVALLGRFDERLQVLDELYEVLEAGLDEDSSSRP